MVFLLGCLLQFGMAQCPMTSTLTTDFWNDCFVRGKGIAPLVNYTLNMVGGSHGGPIANSTDGSWNKSFHGDQEIVADKYQVLALASRFASLSPHFSPAFRSPFVSLFVSCSVVFWTALRARRHHLRRARTHKRSARCFYCLGLL